MVGPNETRRETDRPWRPAEGWLSVLALLVMVLAVAWAVDDAHWAGWGPDGSQTGFLAPAILLAAVWGYIGAKSRWHAGLVHVVGAVIGAAFVIVAVAGVVSVSDDLVGRLADLNRSLALFLYDVLVRQVRSDQTSMFLLVVGCVTWASGQFAAFAVFRHRRPMSAVVLLGLLLLTSMSITLQHQFWYLVGFSAASLLLLVRSSLAQQRVLSAAVRLGETGAAFGLYLRNGIAFIGVALLGAVILTSNASSAPLAGMWNQFDDQFVDMGLALERFAGGITGPARGPSGLFGSSQTIRGFWEGSQSVVFSATSSDGRGYYWRGAAYDEFDGRTWKESDRRTLAAVAPGSPVLAGTAAQVEPGAGRREVTFMVTAVSWGGDALLAPVEPYTVSRGVEVVTAGTDGAVAAVRFTSPIRDGDTFRVTSLVSVEGRGGVTGNELAAAGTVYPAWARSYVAIRDGSIGPLARETADRIVAALPEDQRDPYHVTVALQDYLYRGGGFTYDTDVQALCPSGQTNVVDCLLQKRRGYCEFFATTLAMMLRTQQIPARYVVGYLPGRADPSTGAFTVDRSAAHAWVEVLFPGYGWIPFDPTPGNAENGQVPTRLPVGPPVPTPTPNPSASPGSTFGPVFGANGGLGEDGPRRNPASGGSSGSAGPVDVAPVAAALLALAILIALFAWRRREQRRFPTPEGAWTGLTRLARAFGYGPRPTQTVYEYADLLGETLPGVRPELAVVARARVEATYGRVRPTDVKLVSLRDAYARLRRRLVLLLVPRRIRFRRRPR
jgi:transglutaminase-like putative cysteine protease